MVVLEIIITVTVDCMAVSSVPDQYTHRRIFCTLCSPSTLYTAARKGSIHKAPPTSPGPARVKSRKRFTYCSLIGLRVTNQIGQFCVNKEADGESCQLSTNQEAASSGGRRLGGTGKFV